MKYNTIRMKHVIKGGQWIGDRHFYWPAPGTEGQVPEAMAADAVERGWAEMVEDPDGEAPFPGSEYTESP